MRGGQWEIFRIKYKEKVYYKKHKTQIGHDANV